jgi:hypothetical protein
MVNTPGPMSRRRFIEASGTLLAGFGLSAALPFGSAAAATSKTTNGDLARYRPVTASTTAYAATPPSFVVDRIAETGVRGTGWRALPGDPQWIAVDLQAQCEIEHVTLVFEALLTDPPFDPPAGNPRQNTTGKEILSSAATAFELDVSVDGTTWQTVYRTTTGTGGVTDIPLAQKTKARWIRLVATTRSNTKPLGLNGFQVYGTCDTPRPPATGWTSWQAATARELTVAHDGTVPIESGWHLTLDDWAGATGAELSAPNVDISTWLPATVPGTVLASLVEQGHLPDPVEGMNNLQVPEALSRHNWWYRRQFALPKALNTRPDRHIWLEFDGINHQADIWLNGTQLGTLTHPFARASYDITKSLQQGQQALAVRIHPMPNPGSPSDKGPDGNAFVDSGMLYLDSPTYLSASGWDWMPAIRDRASGIWNHVRLRSTGAVVVGDPRVETKLSGTTADLTITIPVKNVTTAKKATITAEFDQVRVSKTVTLPAGETDVVFTQVHVQNPKLWWPNGYGDPNLHDLSITAEVDNATSDHRTVRFGIRQFDYSYDLPIVIDAATDSAEQTVDIPSQQSRYVRVQCGKRATGWGDSLWTLSVLDSASPGTDLALNATATASSVDDPGNGPENAVDGDDKTRWSSAYEDNQWIQLDLKAAATFDRIVLLWEQAYAMNFTIQVSDDGTTWTDVKDVSNAPVPLKISVNGVPVFCRGGNWGFDELLRRMLPDRMTSVLGMHKDMNFTMIRNWIGSSTREEFYAACDTHGILVWNDFWEAGPFLDDPPGYADIARDTILRYRIHPCIVVWCAANEENPPAAVETGIKQAVADLDDEILYLPNSAAGFVSGHGPYHWVDPASYFDPNTYDTGDFGFHTEIGIPTVSVVESMRNLVGADDPGWPIDAPWYYHDWSTAGNQQPNTYLDAINARLGPSGSLAEFCRKAQLINYESMRAMFEAWNAHLWQDANALLLWMSHPAWHSTVWQTYDYDLDVNGSYYGARKGCEPLHVQASQSDWQVVVANHTPTALTGITVTAQLYDLAGNPVGTPGHQVVDVEASATTTAFTVPFDTALPALHVLRLRMVDQHGTVLSGNDYWRYRTPADLQALNDLPPERLSLTVRHDGAQPTLTVTVRNDGEKIAPMVRLSLLDKHSGDRVLPTQYSDNYLWLLPGESRTVRLTWPDHALPSRAPKVVVTGYNG